jgi:Zn-dependent protease with chaperone function
VNVAEEMSIASGVPVPRPYLLEREQGINAFPIGFGPADAAIIVTAGPLKALNRDKLLPCQRHRLSAQLAGHALGHLENGRKQLRCKKLASCCLPAEPRSH